MECRRVQVFGKVQGVFFRATTKSRADDLKLTGWVRNEPDGSVLIEVEGPADKLKTFLTWCSEGPVFARVDQVIEEHSVIREYKEFEIRY